MADILLIEPNYKNKYPPLGLMKISYFHKHIHKDYVIFAKGRLPEEFDNKKWDRVYVTTLFTFEWEETKKSIEYALKVVKDTGRVYIGGIMSTLMPELFAKHFPTVINNTGLLDKKGTLGLEKEEGIDRLPPDYSILEDIKEQYVYPWNDGYFLYMTRGCGMKCQFCAVQTLEPDYIPYISIREQIAKIDEVAGQKRDLLLMDNNVLRSKDFDKIIDEIIELGFGKGAKFTNPKTGAKCNRYVDFNQGLDAKLMTEHKAKRLGEIALRPARIAFDHIEDESYYKRALEMCAKNGIKYLSNYILFNGEDFTGKGSKYHADTPEDLYNRMKISMDFCDELNEKYGADGRIHIFSFPMKYIPLKDLDRTYIGTNWNGKYLRAVQRMLIPTQGKGVSSRSFFEADFGKTVEEFVENLAMPEDLLGLRGHFVEKKEESKTERNARYERWTINHKRIDEWRRLYQSLSDAERNEFISIIGNNDFSIKNYRNCKTDTQRILFVYNMSYLSILKNIDQLGEVILEYFTSNFAVLHEELLRYLVVAGSVQYSALKGIIDLRGKQFIKEVANKFIQCGNVDSNIFDALYKIQTKNKNVLLNTRILDFAVRYKKVGAISEREFRNIFKAFCEEKISSIKKKLLDKIDLFKEKLFLINSEELGKDIIKENIEKETKDICSVLQFFGD